MTDDCPQDNAIRSSTSNEEEELKARLLARRKEKEVSPESDRNSSRRRSRSGERHRRSPDRNREDRHRSSYYDRGHDPYYDRHHVSDNYDSYGRRRRHSPDPYSRSSRYRSRSRERSKRSHRSSRRSHRSRSRSPARRYRDRSRSHDRKSRERLSRESKPSRERSRSKERPARKPTKPLTVKPDDPDSDPDVRTVFILQLTMKTTYEDVCRFFRDQVGVQVVDVKFLKDRKSDRHRGCAYVELANISMVPVAIAASGVTPEFQRFPILVRESEAEKNANATAVVKAPSTASGPGPVAVSNIKAVYIGNIERVVTTEQLQYLFGQFGPLQKVALQVDGDGISKGFCFLTYADAKSANLSIQTMSGQLLAGRPLKTGWASISTVENAESSEEFPDDSQERIERAHQALINLTGSGLTAMAAFNQLLGAATATGTSSDPTQTAVPTSSSLSTASTTAESSSNTSDDPFAVEGTQSECILVSNVYNKDEETEAGWQDEIKEDFHDECSKFGAVKEVFVDHEKSGGKIYISFSEKTNAEACAKSFAGRWFNKRQLRVKYVDCIPSSG